MRRFKRSLQSATADNFSGGKPAIYVVEHKYTLSGLTLGLVLGALSLVVANILVRGNATPCNVDHLLALQSTSTAYSPNINGQIQHIDMGLQAKAREGVDPHDPLFTSAVKRTDEKWGTIRRVLLEISGAVLLKAIGFNGLGMAAQIAIAVSRTRQLGIVLSRVRFATGANRRIANLAGGVARLSKKVYFQLVKKKWQISTISDVGDIVDKNINEQKRKYEE